jgi:hypothetical protein
MLIGNLSMASEQKLVQHKEEMLCILIEYRFCRREKARTVTVPPLLDENRGEILRELEGSQAAQTEMTT